MKIKKNITINFNAPVILGFSFICLIALLLGMITRGNSTKILFITYRDSLLNPMTYLHFFSHVFGHQNWAHFIGNMSYILLLGPMLEEKHGGMKMVEIILITALVTSLVNFIFFPRVSLCGASGVVFAFILLTSFTSFKEGEIPLTFILVALIFLGQQVFEGVSVRNNVSNLSHIIGGIVGAVFGYFLNVNKKDRY
ncbi:MAG: rhomboid family intramembrane serine protease [Lachnospiraceae bacterium]|nr:rhomboid family intramembrane serine protease [Lachnospiraceae bacterium]